MNRDDIIREMGWLVPELVESELLNRIERVVRLAEAAAAKCGECGKSAPDLLAALKKCEALALSDNDPEDLLEKVRIAAHAALALAKGKT